MKIVLKSLALVLMLSLVVASCGDEEMVPETCTTDPSVTVEQNIAGTWEIDGESDETVTFNVDGTGTSSEAAFHFSTTNNGNSYNKFGWIVESDTIVVVTYDYSPDVPVNPFIISENHTVFLNNCDKIEMEDGFGNRFELNR